MAKSKKFQKKNHPQKYAPIGLWLGGIALLVTGLLLVVKFMLVAQIFTMTNDKGLNLALWISAGLIVVGPALFVLLDPKRARRFLAGRQARYGSNAILLLAAFLGILLVVNILAFNYPGTPMDLTESKEHTLAPETLDTLAVLPEPVHATAFFTSQYPTDTARQLLENYKTYSDGKFTYEFIDPDQNPVAAQNAGISGDGKIYLQMGSRHEIVAYASEQDVTSALWRLMNPGEQTVYFLTGHGERDIETFGDTTIASVRAALEAKNYTVKTLNLLATNAIPADAKAIIIAGPLDPLTDGEITLLRDYSTVGGALVIMVEPVPLTNYGANPDPLAAYLATQWGVTLNNDIVIDTNSGTQPLYAVAAAYGDHSITRKLQGQVAFFPDARSLSLGTGIAATPQALASTIQDAWGETNFADQNAKYDAGADTPGPIILAAAAEDSITGSRLVVFGDSDFASDMFFSQYANGDILINAIDWAAGEEQMINLSKPAQTPRTLKPTSGVISALLWLSFLCILPGLVVAGGVASWLIRKSRG
ncbi:MAG: hypothetical protein FD146_589 [Anaerolineaceae bacterium]|nr:MAG: hypothetical protein FD146_589 [Anaerolineaceae bacterium]